MTGQRRSGLLALAALYAAWKLFYSIQTDAEPLRLALFGVAAVMLGGLAAVRAWTARSGTGQAASREAG